MTGGMRWVDPEGALSAKLIKIYILRVYISRNYHLKM